MRNVYETAIGKPEGMRHLRRHRRGLKDDIKTNPKVQSMKVSTGFICTTCLSGEGLRKHDKKSWGSKKKTGNSIIVRFSKLLCFEELVN
jgi:hypothetical protein